MKNKFAFSLILLAFINCANAQEKSKNEQLLDRIIFLAQENSVNTEKVDWNMVSKIIKENLDIKDSSTNALAIPVRLLLTELNDFHGALIINGERYMGDVKKNDFQLPYELNQEIPSTLYKESLEGYKIKAEILSKNIGYIVIPAINIGSDQNAIVLATNTIRDSICNLLSKKPTKLIIDLRTNIGGNMYPMLSGLGLLFPNMQLGGDSKDGKSFYSEWELKDGNLYMGGSQMTSLPINCKCTNKIKKYVVLTSRYTTSSGEAVASSLKGQQNITLLGEQTAGYSSTNSWYQLSEEILFSPAIAYYMSMDKTFHINGIFPDIQIKEVFDLDNLKKGKTIDKAIEILK
ncbi:S41 family peptidase [Algoriphagus sp. C2-6-M1]|uniref:S41 family peptidase n=1 Tax=Algoriphagus persicinus TaxID=3108754 RepID=UPI002B3BFD9B|nr:S41 family peptidase [Algoriphagus sp. C2-6-M1]MEB2782446.1 S41 family peptidase [Algoriphagus sp. C2-6-M1]